MGSMAMPVCDTTHAMNLFILRILWLGAQWIIKVDMASLSPLIISAAVIYFISTFHWALKPSLRLSPTAAPVLESSGNAEKATKTLLCPKKSPPAAAIHSLCRSSVDAPRAGVALELCASSHHSQPHGTLTQRRFWVPQAQAGGVEWW